MAGKVYRNKVKRRHTRDLELLDKERREETFCDKRYKTTSKGGKVAETRRSREEKTDCKNSEMFYFVLVVPTSPEGTNTVHT